MIGQIDRCADDEGRIHQRAAQAVLAPHHSLGHAGGAAGVDEEQVVGRAVYPQWPAVALGGQGFERLGEIWCRLGHAILDDQPAPHQRQARLDLLDDRRELAREDHRRRVGIFEDVVNLVGHIAVVDIDVDLPGFERRDQSLHVGGMVAQVEGGLFASLCATIDQGAGQVVGATVKLAPGDDAFAMDQGGVRGIDHTRHRVEEVAIVPARPGHADLPKLRVPSG